MDIQIEKIKALCTELDEIVVVIDKIGSGFNDREKLALTLLLFFQQKNVLNSLAQVRTFIHQELEKLMGEHLYNEFIELEIEKWKPLYEISKDELLKMLE